MKYPDKTNGIAKPKEYMESKMTPFVRVASEADKARIDPNTGPIQGVQPKAKAAPIKKGKK